MCSNPIHSDEALTERDRELRRKDDLLEAVMAISRQLLEVTDALVVMPTVLRRLGEAACIHRVTLFLERDSSDAETFHEVVAEWCAEGMITHAEIGLMRIPNCKVPSFVQPLQRGESCWSLIEDFADEVKPGFEALDVRSTGCVPILVEGRYVGAITFDDCVAPRRWSQAEIAMLTSAAHALAAALHRQRLEREHREEIVRYSGRVERQARVLAAIAQSAEELLGAPDPESCIDAVLARIGKETKADRACLAVLEWTDDDPLIHGWQEITHEWCRIAAYSQMNSPHRRFPMKRADPTWTQCCQDLEKQGRILTRMDDVDEPFRSKLKALGIQWTLCYPIHFCGRLRALLGFDYATPLVDDNETDANLLKTIATTLSAALQRRETEAATTNMVAEERSRVAREMVEEQTQLANLLATVVSSSRELIDADDFEAGVRVWLGRFGVATEAIRASFYDLVMHEPSGLPTLRILTEWTREGIEGSLEVSFENPTIIDPRGAEDHMAGVTSGIAIVLHTEETAEPMRSFLADQGNASVVCMPIIKDGLQWGALSFDFPVRRELTKSDLSVLQTAANTLGTVIKRNEAIESMMNERDARVAERIEAESARREAVASERARLAGVIHDTLAQGFVGILLQLEAAEEAHSRGLLEISKVQFDKAREHARYSLGEARRSALAIHPLGKERDALERALHNLCERASVAERLQCVFDRSGEPRKLPGPASEMFLRIANEGLNNAIRHGEATAIRVELHYREDQTRLLVLDNGTWKQTSTQSAGLGLAAIMREVRASGGQAEAGPLKDQSGSRLCIELPHPLPDLSE